jgi:hypothetical protein
MEIKGALGRFEEVILESLLVANPVCGLRVLGGNNLAGARPEANAG